MIHVENLTKRYGAFTALDGVSFHVPAGRVMGFLGANGAGKTTTLRILSCYMPPSSGMASIGGFDVVRASDEVRMLIGYMPESVPLYGDMRVLEYLRFRARLKGVSSRDVGPAVARVIAKCHLGEKQRTLISALYKGQRQRVGIADALVHDPKLLILDEPTSGLDPDQRIEVRKMIEDLAGEHTVLLSTHILPEAEAICSDVLIIHKGRIAASTPVADVGTKERWRVRMSATGSAAAQQALPASEHDEATFDSADEAMRHVQRGLQQGQSLVEFGRQRRNLEDLFMSIVAERGTPS